MTDLTPANAEIQRAIDTFVEGMMARDVPGLNKLLDETFVLTHITGYRQTKADWLDEIGKESMCYFSEQRDRCAIRIEGHTAEVILGQKLDARIWGRRQIWPLQQIIKLQKRASNWIILSSDASLY